MTISHAGTTAIETARDCGGNHVSGTSGQWIGKCINCGQPC